MKIGFLAAADGTSVGTEAPLLITPDALKWVKTHGHLRALPP
jgi:hypothetical protein